MSGHQVLNVKHRYFATTLSVVEFSLVGFEHACLLEDARKKLKDLIILQMTF